MPLKPPPTKSKRDPIEAGSHLAICTMIAELGTHDTNFGPKYQVAMSFDFPDLRIDIEKDGKELNLPMRKSKTFTFSYHEKSNLGQTIKSWRGALPDDDFDLFSLLGENAMVTITHDTKDDGRVYDNITTVSKLPARISPAEPETDLLKYSFSDNGKNIPDGLPKWVVEKIESCKEWGYMQDAANRLNSDDGPIIEPEQDYGVDDDCPF